MIKYKKKLCKPYTAILSVKVEKSFVNFANANAENEEVDKNITY